jgi:hypothetical protein
MTEPLIICPKCNTSIKLTESLAAPLIAKTRKQLKQQLAEKEREFAKREITLRDSQKAITQARRTIDAEIAKKLQTERTIIAKREAAKARLALRADIDQRDELLSKLQSNLKTNNAKLAEAQRAQAAVIRKTRELDNARRELDLSVEKKVQESLAVVRDQATADAEDRLKARVSEKELQITGMRRQIEELRRRADQGSQQLQGEAFEFELEKALRDRFSGDVVEAVRKGEFGGDVIHRVRDEAGQFCGTMLWEAKSTKAWNHKWFAKLRRDQHSAKAEIGLIVSNVLPSNVETFDRIGSVWVTTRRFAIPLAIALRHSLIEACNSRHVASGQRTKMEMVYQYLTGPQFRHRIGVIVETFVDMQGDLDRERKAMVRIWAKREEQLKNVLDSSAGLYGDLQGIAGRALPEIESLGFLSIRDVSGAE